MPQWSRRRITAAVFGQNHPALKPNSTDKLIMHPTHRIPGISAAFIAFVLLLAGHTWAAPVFTTAMSGPNAPSTTTDEVTFAADVSSTDLLHGIQGTGGLWNANGSSPDGLNDGAHGGDFDAIGLPAALGGATWARDGDRISFREFVLGAGPTGGGFDITSIQSIASWQGAGFPNQKYEVRVRRLGETGFPVEPLLTVDYQPFPATPSNNGGSTKVNVTDTTGILASGVVAIRFDILDTVSNQAGGVVMREIDVFGTPSNDLAPPAIVSLAPANNATGVAPSSNLVVTFNEGIVLGTGTITIRDLDTPADLIITLPDPRVSVSGSVLTINPASDLPGGINHAVRIDSTAVKDTAGNPFAGIVDDTTWKFITGVPDVTPPALLTLSPADDAAQVAPATNLVATFDEPIALGSGSITVRNLDASTEIVMPIGGPGISVAGALLTINPAANLAPNTRYAIGIPSGAIRDLAGNPFTGFTNQTTWNFRTAATPLRIMCLGDSITVGYTDNPGWTNHPFKFGYRSGLYTRLNNAGYNFQFVGGSTEPWTGISGDPTNGGTYKPAFDLRDIGQDHHRGYGGASIGGTTNAVSGYLTSDQPDVILLLIGINGIGTGSPAALNTLVNKIVTEAPTSHLIVAQITPRATFNQDLYNYNVYIRDTLVPTYVMNGHKVSTADLYSLFLTDPANYASAIQSGVLSNNINHPDNPRYDLMAQKWFESIEALGLGPATFAKWIQGYPGVGAQTGLTDDADGDGIDNGVENLFGTDPTKASPGLVAGQAAGGVFTFTHPQGTLAGDLVASYRWSKDLQTFHADGTTDPDNTRVALTVLPNTPLPGTTTVNATVTGTAAARLFLRVEVTKP
jgi:lysophospholipase L1-like esterase